MIVVAVVVVVVVAMAVVVVDGIITFRKESRSLVLTPLRTLLWVWYAQAVN